MAEQKEPVERRVALKIIKPGMDSRQVIARFEAERQALTMMDHPNIAKVFEAGTTESGRPYFVMELVKGISITKYCDEKRLSLNERLELMIPVCQAIRHAHQKGIIHRDIKPTNVLVAQYDSQPVPKVIDFGVAKATAHKLTERTMFTELGQVVGTLEYMSPEQAELNQLDIDTRSDIYSLGVLLYELLTGSTPFDKQKLRTAAFHEMLRIIREDEPETVSTRLAKTRTRSTQPAAPNAEIPAIQHSSFKIENLHELDWIVMRALEKDRSRRYESASSLAADIQRYLNGELVEACPPSATYRFRKFARKNKTALTTASLLAASLLLGTTLSFWQAVRATAAEAQASANETKAKSEEQKATALAQAEAKHRLQAEKNFEAALDAVDRMLGHLRSEELQNIPQIGPLRQRILRDAVEFYERIPAQAGLSDEMRLRVAETWFRIDNSSGNIDVDGSAARGKAIELITQLLAEHPDNPKYLATFARFETQVFERAFHNRHDFQAAKKASQTMIDVYTRLIAQQPTESTWLKLKASALADHGNALHALGKLEEAVNETKLALSLLDPGRPENGFQRGRTLAGLAAMQSEAAPGEFDDVYRQAVDEFHKYFANNETIHRNESAGSYSVKVPHSSEGEQRVYGNKLRSIAAAFSSRHPLEAEKLFDESIEVWRRICVPSHHRRHDFDDLVLVLVAQSRFLRRLATASLAGDASSNPAARLVKAESLFQEAIKTERHAATHFAALLSRFGLVQLLQEESEFILGRAAKPVAETPNGEDGGSARLRADAHLTEAIQLCRQLAAEFPGDATYRDRLTALLKLQAQHFGPKQDVAEKSEKPK